MFHGEDALCTVAVERAGIFRSACIGEFLVEMVELNFLRSECVFLRSCTYIINGTSPCPLGVTFKNEWKVGIPSKINRKLFTTNAYQGRAKTLIMKQNTCWQLTCERFAHLYSDGCALRYAQRFLYFFWSPSDGKKVWGSAGSRAKKKNGNRDKKNLFMLSSDCVLFISSFVHRYVYIW